MAAVGSGVVALVAVGGDVSSPGSHRCCRDRGGQCKWRGGGQGGGQVPGGEQDLLLPSPALPVDWTLPCREKAWAPQGGCAPRAAWPHCPQQSCLPCDPRGGLPARCHWPGEEQTGPPGSPAPPERPTPSYHTFTRPDWSSRAPAAGLGPPAWPRHPELGAPRVPTWGTEGRGGAGQDPTAPRACAVSPRPFPPVAEAGAPFPWRPAGCVLLPRAQRTEASPQCPACLPTGTGRGGWGCPEEGASPWPGPQEPGQRQCSEPPGPAGRGSLPQWCATQAGRGVQGAGWGGVPGAPGRG